MITVLPGQPESRPQALCTGVWNGKQIIAYISGNAISIFTDPDTLVQTIYNEDADHLLAIALDEASGKIAVCTATIVRLYQPAEETEPPQWKIQSCFAYPDQPLRSEIYLSWGASEELLVAGSCLWLYSTLGEPQIEWKKELPTPTLSAILSYDSAYIASIGRHDRLIKIWRRLSYGTDQVQFDLAYLQHPKPVVSIRWRKPYHVEQSVDNALCSVCADGILRVWVSSAGHGSQSIQFWCQIDLLASGGPSNVSQNMLRTNLRWAFIVDGRDFSLAIEKALQHRTESNATLDNLVAAATKMTEICMVCDGAGSMTAWGIEGAGLKSESSHHAFNISQISSPDFDFLQKDQGAQYVPHVEMQSYCDRTSGQLHLLIHLFTGELRVYRAAIVNLLSSQNNARHLELAAMWSGHSEPIGKIVRNFSGRAIVSSSAGGQIVAWKHHLSTSTPKLSRQSMIPRHIRVHKICVLRKGRFVVFLADNTLSLWDCRELKARQLAQVGYTIPGKPLCLLILPRQKIDERLVAHVAIVTSAQRGLVWEVKLPVYAMEAHEPPNDYDQVRGAIRELGSFDLPGTDEIATVLPVDPAGSSPVVTGFLDVFAKDVAISCTNSGQLAFWTAQVDREKAKVVWLVTSLMETGITEPALLSGSTLKKAALVDAARSQISIWDVGASRLEYTESYGSGATIQDLDWTSTPDSQSILAIGFPHEVLVLSQMRFDYLNEGPAWAPIRRISTRELTPHPIGDSAWLGDGHLVIGAGNQLFVHDRIMDLSQNHITGLRLQHRKGGTGDLFDVVRRLNGPLPIFHPQFLGQCILVGKTSLVQKILLALHRALKFLVDGEAIDDYLGIQLADFYETSQRTTSAGVSEEYNRQLSAEEDAGSFDEETAVAINEKLTKVPLSQLSGHEQIQLADMIECLGFVEKHRRSMDENGARFMLFFRQHALRKGRANEIHLSWREINWAYHSDSQDILVDFVSKQYHGTLLWKHARESGMFMWLTNHATLKRQFEQVARNEYSKAEPKDPTDCSLFYMALRKKTILQGLWRLATWNKEHVATQKLLANNFEDSRWKTVALKNAYALLSKRRFEYAAAFFLLADRLQDAVNVCLGQIKDLQLAIAIARIYEGDDGPVFRRLLEEDVLSVAAQEGNRWLASWAFWMLHRRDMAVRALVMPVYSLLETPYSPGMKSRLFLTDDPALIVLYSYLRQMTLQTIRGASKVTPRIEWEFVLHSAKLYDRMGCDILGLDLVRNWEFFRPNIGLPSGLGGGINPLKLLRRRSSLVIADLPAARLSMGLDEGATSKVSAASPFVEPDTSSLLDNFGF